MSETGNIFLKGMSQKRGSLCQDSEQSYGYYDVISALMILGLYVRVATAPVPVKVHPHSFCSV